MCRCSAPIPTSVVWPRPGWPSTRSTPGTSRLPSTRSRSTLADAVELLVDRLPGMVAFAGKTVEGAEPVTIQTTGPERAFRLTLGPEVALEPTDDPGPDPLALPPSRCSVSSTVALDAEHTPAGVIDPRLADLRQAFLGF